jgi:hypothetical protein
MIPAVLPLVLVVLGVVALAAGFAILRSLGPGYRIGRLLATTRRVPIGEARRIAESGARRYVAIEGRIDSEAAFEDAAHRPLVLRRTRLEARVERRWTRFEESLEAVPFEVRDGLEAVTVDVAALGDGLVVIPRESRGVVSDLADRAPASLPPDAPAVATIHQVSSIEHATVLGWPALDAKGGPVMTAGSGRPLVLTTLDTSEAMRVLARGERARPRLAALALVLGAACLVLGLIAGVLGAIGLPAALGGLDAPRGPDALPGLGAAVVLAADPSRSPLPTGPGGDTRSPGQGPGLVGAPGPAVAGVIVIGLLAVGATLVYVRATGGARPR